MGLLQDRIAVVTGAAGGIGSATARAFVREGATVVLTDLDDERGTKLEQELVDAGSSAVFVGADVTHAPDVDEVVRAAVSRFGRLDVAVNCAGYIGVLSPLLGYPQEEFDRVLEVNVRGTWNCLRAELAAMAGAGNGGAICNVSSVAGVVGAAGDAPYVTAKHAIVGMTRAAALEHASDGIRVNVIAPGSTDTEMPQRLTGGDPNILAALRGVIPIGRFGFAEEIAEPIVFLCSPGAAFATGAVFSVDGGQSAA
ncbi:SDR family oxidoreductase [Actinomycetospora corticicola]|uniref:NAD(P)-dependent dehydrogenase (Short-subunit alcohol dehydrogenase family) n=1 Tax=Actinomycetospora corticicola TaxID=663602 RepID=A0A7Y9DYB1_9PSEU|nr:glucose 1-dehydrogenase [Actinomycetospora corticicola]NYD37457.1 NAD(P)-dependent dehydrogenase (short-subunit alcohol dehydrogenase family) [Actinomycetospora corticicola]